MIIDRLYSPTGGERIYHYCPSGAFIEIVQSKTMWASGYYTLNDTLEREWGYSILLKAADQIKGSTGRPFIKAVLGMINSAYAKSMVMISSFSLVSDVLSQWRAYAHDGRGFAIGFEAAALEMPAKKLRSL